MKHKLVIIEGPDRIGKDSLLKMNENLNLVSYIQNNHPPQYRNKEEFRIWLEDFLYCQANDLIKFNRNILMARLFTSDFVYSSLFNRSSIINLIYNILSEHFDFEQIIITYKDFNQYVNRCKLASCELEYSKEEFDKLQNYYLTSPFNFKMKTTYFITKDFDFKEINNYISRIV